MSNFYKKLLWVCSATLCFAAAPSQLCANPSLSTAQETSDTSHVTEEDGKPTGTLSLGAGFDVQDGFVLGTELSQTRLFGVDGLQLRLQSNLGALTQSADLSVAGEPILHSPWFWRVGSTFRRQILTPGADLQGDAVGGNMLLGISWTPRLRTSLGYRLESVDLDGLQDLAGAPLDLSAHTGERRNLSSLQGRMTYISDRAQRSERAREALPRGLRLAGLVEYADENLGSAFTFTRTEAHASWGTLLPKGIHLRLEGHIGATWADDQAEIPLFERYRLGTQHSFVRNALAPTGPSLQGVNGSTFPLGGSGAAYGRATGHVPLIPSVDLYLLTGFEAGAIQGDLDASLEPEASASFFGGVSWLSPIGPIQAGLGVPVQPEGVRTDQAPVFFLNVGGSF